MYDVTTYFRFMNSRIENESHLKWFPIAPTTRMTYELMLRESILQNAEHFSLAVGDEMPYFEIREERSLPFVQRSDAHVKVTVDMSLDRGYTMRKLYRASDWVSDIGGFSVSMLSLLVVALLLINYNKMDSWIV